MRMLNWLTTNFMRGQSLRRMNIASEKNAANAFLANLVGCGCNVLKSRDGRTAMIMMDGNSNVPPPPGLTFPWQDHPFRPSVEDGGATLRIGQGYIHIGSQYFPATGITGDSTNWAKYDWPADGDVDTIDVSELADGDYLAYMSLAVSPSNGFFTASYKPALGSCAASAYTGLDAVTPIICRFSVADGKVSKLRADLRDNIRAFSSCDMYFNVSDDDFFFTNYKVSAVGAGHYRRIEYNEKPQTKATVSDEGGPLLANVWIDGSGTDDMVPYDLNNGDVAKPSAETEVN